MERICVKHMLTLDSFPQIIVYMKTSSGLMVSGDKFNINTLGVLFMCVNLLFIHVVEDLMLLFDHQSVM